jgi:hypothetical protein
VLQIVVSEGTKQCLLDGARKINQQVLIVVKSQELLCLVHFLNLFLLIADVRFLQLGQSPENEQITLSQGKLLVGLDADEYVIQVGHPLQLFGCLPQVDRNLLIAQGSPEVGILTLDHAHVSNNRERVLLVDKRVGSSPENNIGNESLLFVGSSMLPDWNCHGEVVVG